MKVKSNSETTYSKKGGGINRQVQI